MLAGVGLVLDNQRLFSLAGSQAIALIEEEIGLAQPSDGARSRPSVPANYLRIHRVCQRFQAICPWSCAHTFSAEIDPLKPKSRLFSMSQPSGERSNMPTDRKLRPDEELARVQPVTPGHRRGGRGRVEALGHDPR